MLQHFERYDETLSSSIPEHANVLGVPVAVASSPSLSQYKTSPVNRSTSHGSSSASHVLLFATSMLWCNNID